MSDLLDRLRALRGDAPDAEVVPERPAPDPSWGGVAAQLGAASVVSSSGVHLVRRARLTHGARHGRSPVGGGGLHPWLERWAARSSRAARAGRSSPPLEPTLEPTLELPPTNVVYLDTETTGLAGGTGTYAFLVGVGTHDADGFLVEQLFLPGPEHERVYLSALSERLAGATAVVSYNGASFDLPLVRTRYAMHGLPDPLEGVPHLDLLPLARRLWRRSLPDCTLGTVERQVLGARRSARDVPGAEVPARYLAFLRSRDARPLRGVLEHNQDDIVALAAMRSRIEDLFAPAKTTSATAWPGPAFDALELHGLARWLEAIGEQEAALAGYLAAESRLADAAWDAARLLRRTRRFGEAAARWTRLATDGDARAWIELAKHREHRLGDIAGALEALEAARRCGGARHDDLDRRRARLLARGAHDRG